MVVNLRGCLFSSMSNITNAGCVCFLQVKVDIRLNNSAGLGAQSNRAVSMDQGGSLNKSRKKAEINLKTRTRYEKAKTCGLFSDMNEASEEDVN